MSSKSFLHLSHSLKKKKPGGNCLVSWIAVLHTGKRWFIICPVEETPTSSQETPSDGTATQSPGSSATTQPADSGTARPPASRGDFVSVEHFQHKLSHLHGTTAPLCGSCMKDSSKRFNIKVVFKLNFLSSSCLSSSRRGLILHNVRWKWRFHL